MSIENNPIGRTDMLSRLALREEDISKYEDMSDQELRVLYEERLKTSDDYLDDYNEPLKQMSKHWDENKKL